MTAHSDLDSAVASYKWDYGIETGLRFRMTTGRPDSAVLGATFDADQIAEMLSWPETVGLGEMMNYPGVINGDIFDDLNFKRLNKRHFACLRVIRRHSDRDDFRLVWVRGNHDSIQTEPIILPLEYEVFSTNAPRRRTPAKLWRRRPAATGPMPPHSAGSSAPPPR